MKIEFEDAESLSLVFQNDVPRSDEIGELRNLAAALSSDLSHFKFKIAHQIDEMLRTNH